MFPVLAYAEGPDNSGTNLILTVYWLGIIAAAAVLAGIPAIVARRRRHRHAEALALLMFLWALVMAVSVIMTVTSQITWSNEHTRQIMTGYLNPNDAADRPTNPWGLWIIAGAAYVVGLVWTLAPMRSPPGDGAGG